MLVKRRITKIHSSFLCAMYQMIISTMATAGKSKARAKEKIPRLTEESIKQSIAEYKAGNYKEFKTVKDLLHDIDSYKD